MKAFGWSALCAVGVTLLVSGSMWGLERRVPAWLVSAAAAAEPALEAAKKASTKAEETAPELALGSAKVEAPSLASAKPEATAAVAPGQAVEAVELAGPRMPDLGRERVDRAMRQMRELGVRLRVTDDYGNPIDRWSGSGYRIRPGSVTVEPGTALEPRQTVDARAYELASSFAAGY